MKAGGKQEMKKENYNSIKNQKLAGKLPALSAGLAILMLTSLFQAEPCFAQTVEGLANSVSAQFKSIYTSIGIVISALATIAIAFCAIKLILWDDEPSRKQTKQWMLYIAIGIAIYWLAGVIVDVVKNMATSTTGTETETSSTGIIRWFSSI